MKFGIKGNKADVTTALALDPGPFFVWLLAAGSDSGAVTANFKVRNGGLH